MIRVAGPGQPQEMPMEEMPAEEPQVPMEEEQPQQLYTADKQAIMEAMQMIAQALMILEEVCPPEGMGSEEEMPMEEEMPEGEVPEEV